MPRSAVTCGLMVAAGWTVQVSAQRGDLSPFTQEAVERGLLYEIRPSSAGVLTHGFGIAIADLNNSGWQDLVLLGHSAGVVGLFENQGGHFTDRSFIDAGGNLIAKHTALLGSGIAVADYDGDGLLDVYITLANAGETLGPNLLLRNEGDFNFADVSSLAGVNNPGNGQAAIWGDYDNDGWLDLYVVNFTIPNYASNPAMRNKLYRNRGDGTFEDVSISAGLDDHGVGFAAVFSDMNRNGWLDLYLVNDRGHLIHPSQSWRNNAGVFENNCATSGLCIGLWAMCVGAGDVTGNGFADFYVTNVAHPMGYNGWNPLLINHGDGTFTEQCTAAGVCQLVTSWASFFFDYNNNGWLDLYVCNEFQNNRLYANSGRFPLVNIGPELNIAGTSGRSYNAAFGDLTGNGALDIVLNDYGSDGLPRNVQLLINHEGEKRNWARFHVVGSAGNVHAIGSNVEVTANGHTQWRELYAGGNNFKAQNELMYHFGLGDAMTIDAIVVNWPGGQTSRRLSSYPINETWTIYPQQVLGDANRDGVIDVMDLLALFGAWGTIEPGNELLDINGDGAVNITDLLALLAKWGPL